LTFAISSAVAVNNPSEVPCHLAVLDNIPANRSPILLSTCQAKKRPHEIIEEFFYRREGNDLGKVAPRDLPVKSPTGLRKIKKAMERATHYGMTVGPSELGGSILGMGCRRLR